MSQVHELSPSRPREVAAATHKPWLLRVRGGSVEGHEGTRKPLGRSYRCVLVSPRSGTSLRWSQRTAALQSDWEQKGAP